MCHGTKSSIKERLRLCHPPDEDEGNAALILEISPIIHKFANIKVDGFHDLSYVLYRYCMELATGFK